MRNKYIDLAINKLGMLSKLIWELLLILLT